MRRSKPAEPKPEKVLHQKHPLAIRWFHWINFPVLFTMIWSGMLIYWANRVFHFNAFGHSATYWVTRDPSQTGVNDPLFPDAWYEPTLPHGFHGFLAGPLNWFFGVLQHGVDKLGDDGHVWSADSRLAEGMGWHFLFAWIFTLNGLLYVTFLLFSGQWRKIVPKPAALWESIQVVLVDLHLSKKKLPVRKYNAAQQIAYTGVIVMGGLMVLTGIAIYKPSSQSWLTLLFGGYTVARFIHFWVTMLFVAFFLVHVGQVIRTGWNNFRGMVTGFELVTAEEKPLLEAER